MHQGKNEKGRSFKQVREIYSHGGGEWRQKSRALWLRGGDKRTKFLHKVANSNRRKNSIDSLLIDGTLFTNRMRIKEHIVQF
jgi:hypothetical protein